LKKSISLKEINRLAIPALFAGIAEPLLSIVDTAFVGHMPQLATESLAAVGLVGVFLSMIVWILGQTRSAISTTISQYLGANKLEAVKNIPAQAIFILLLLSFFIVAISYPLAENIFKLYNADKVLLSLSVKYFHIRVFGLPFTLFTFAIFGIFRGLQNTFYPMIIAIFGAVINVVLDYILIYGVEGVLDPMNIEGAAYASIIAQLLMAITAVILLYKKTDIRRRLQFPFNPEMKNLVQMIFNLFIRTIALNVALYFGSSFATKYGNNSLAAYTISVNIWFFFAFIIDGYASAGNILSGKLYGAKDFINLEDLGKKLSKYGIVLGSILALVSFILYYFIGNIFIKDDEVLQQFYNIFWIVLIMQPLNGVAFIFDGIFKGLGFMKYLRNTLLIATLLGFVPTIMILDYFGFRLYGIWIAFTIWMILRAVILFFRFIKFVRMNQTI